MKSIIINALGRGKSEAKTCKELVALTGIKNRELRRFIAEIIDAKEAPICSDSVTGGYYLAATERDFNDSIGELYKRVRMLERRADSMTTMRDRFVPNVAL